MAKRLSEATTADHEGLLHEIRGMAGSSCAQEAAQRFVNRLYEAFCGSLVLLRLFMTLRYDRLPEEDRRFAYVKCRDTQTSHLIHSATPIFTLLGTRGEMPEWNDRRASAHFRCIPLVSTAYVASLSMLSRQFASVGFDLDLVDSWQTKVAARGRADGFRGMLFIEDAATDRDSLGRMIVPKQDFVAACGVKTTLGFGCGYASHPALVTLFAFTSENVERSVAEPMSALLDAYVDASEELVKQGRVFLDKTF